MYVRCDLCRSPFIAVASHHKYNIATGAALLALRYCSIHHAASIFTPSSTANHKRHFSFTCFPVFYLSFHKESFKLSLTKITFVRIAFQLFLCFSSSNSLVEIVDSEFSVVFFCRCRFPYYYNCWILKRQRLWENLIFFLGWKIYLV